MIYQNANENFRQGTKVCPECGSKMNEQEQYFIQECDRCLSKKEEI
ncbi:protein YhfH [Bacillus marasmi]|nr:protein YhfH [Bacillus marasmi]